MKLSDEYVENQSWGISASIDLHDCDPELVRSADGIKKFVHDLCEEIDVTPFGECVVVNFGEREDIAGFSMTQLIETSLISGHFVNKTNNIYLDVFSCKYYDPDLVAKRASDFFKASDFTMRYQLRK